MRAASPRRHADRGGRKITPHAAPPCGVGSATREDCITNDHRFYIVNCTLLSTVQLGRLDLLSEYLR